MLPPADKKQRVRSPADTPSSTSPAPPLRAAPPLPATPPTPAAAAAAAAAPAVSREVDVLFLKVAWKRLLKELSSLPRAISIMAAVAGFSALGTIIPQNKVAGAPGLPMHPRILMYYSCDTMLFI